MAKATPVPTGYVPYRDEDGRFIMFVIIRRKDGDIECLMPLNDAKNHNIRAMNRKAIASVANEYHRQMELERMREELEEAKEQLKQLQAG